MSVQWFENTIGYTVAAEGFASGCLAFQGGRHGE
jgi:hypothetical protein